VAVKKPVDEDDIYVGRPTKWGNPYRLTRFTRKDAIYKFEKFLDNSKLVEQIHELDGKKLFCHWALLPCHADILIKKSKDLSIKIFQANEL